MKTMEIADVGPITRLSIPIPEFGGICVLAGRNGAGKTTALDAASALIRGQGSLSNRDGTARGHVEGFGARITVGRSTRRTGELECLSLEGRLSVAELVEPNIKDPGAADAKRIKALVSLSGRKADLESYARLAGGPDQLMALLKPDTISCTDPVDQAARVKRDLEAAARKQEDVATNQSGAALGFRKAAEGIDLAGESDAAVLQRALEQAIADESAVKARAKAAVEAGKRAEEARQTLAEQQASYSGPNATEATAAVMAAKTKASEAEQAVNQARSALKDAETKAQFAAAELAAANTAYDQAIAYAALQQSAQAAIDAAAATQAPTEAEALAAVDAVSRARRALENGAAIRRARQQIEAAEEAEDLAREARKAAEQLRDAARGTDDVLSQAVACPVLRVESGRLVTDTARGVTLYAELSMGERWRIALDLAADQVGEGGIIVVPQEAFESLDPRSRQAIHEHAIQRRVVILTAEATDGDLRAEVYGNGNGKSNGNS